MFCRGREVNRDAGFADESMRNGESTTTSLSLLALAEVQASRLIKSQSKRLISFILSTFLEREGRVGLHSLQHTSLRKPLKLHSGPPSESGVGHGTIKLETSAPGPGVARWSRCNIEL